VASAPFSIFGKATYARKEMTDDELRTLDIDWSVTKAAERTIYPQAHMSTMFNDTKLTKDQLIKVVTPSDLWREVTFQVFANAGWTQDGVAAVTVDTEYPDSGGGSPHDWSMQLTKDAPSAKKTDWLDSTALSTLKYKYEVVFAPDAIPGPSQTLDQDWQQHDGAVLTVEPRDLFRTVQAEVFAVDVFPFDRYPAVHAFLRFRDEDGSFSQVVDGVLSPANKKLSFHCRARRDSQAPTEVRIQFTAINSPMIDTGWMVMDAESYIVTDPLPSALIVRALVAGDRKKIQNVVVDLQYQDATNHVMESGSLVFDSTSINSAQTWVAHPVDATKRIYEYRVTMVFSDGSVFETDWIESKAPTLAVSPAMLQTLEVEVSLPVAKASGVDRIKVHLQYDDDADQVHEVDDVELSRAGDTSNWKVNLKDPGKQSYQYTVTWVSTDGFDKKLGPLTTSQRYLQIDGTPPSG
jgi:hypothetical protein